MTTPNQQENRAPGLDALRALNSIQPPEGMQQRLIENIAERVREQQLRPVARGFRKYAWELWAGASIAVVAAAIIVCIFALQTHHTENSPQMAGMPIHTASPAPTYADAAQANPLPHKAARSYRAKLAHRAEAAAYIPHTPPPQPLTEQEHLLLALASNPSLAIGMAQTQTISQHGLGANALFELDHEQLQPMRSESKLLQPLPPLPHNLP